MKIFAEKFRGFSFLELDLSNLNFLVGDNSSGKTSILHLIQMVTACDLGSIPKMDEDFGVGRYDYFSPYFDYANVTFGFVEDSDVGVRGKILTVKRDQRDRNGMPRAIACSHFANGEMYTFRTFGRGKIKYKKYKIAKSCEIEELLKNHNFSKDYTAYPFPKGVDIFDNTLVFIMSDNLVSELFREAVVEISAPSSRLVSATRALPEKFYSFSRKYEVHGKHFASMWVDFFSDKSKKLFDSVDKFGQDCGLFDHVEVERIARNFKESPLIVHVEKNGRKFLLHQVGVGVSQVIPIMMESIYVQIAPIEYVLLVQQPELHLHPVAQAALGSYFFNLIKNNFCGFIETHSSYLLDRFRADFRDHFDQEVEVSRDSIRGKVKILFCSNSVEGNSVSVIDIDDDGNLVNDPDEYHQFFVNEFIRTTF